MVSAPGLFVFPCHKSGRFLPKGPGKTPLSHDVMSFMSLRAYVFSGDGCETDACSGYLPRSAWRQVSSMERYLHGSWISASMCIPRI